MNARNELRKRMARLTLMLLLILASRGAYSQKTITTISLQLSFPQQEYKETYPVTGVGLRWNVMHRPNLESPISIGGELGFLVTSSDSRVFDIYYLGLFDRYRVSASNNIFSMAFKARADLVDAEKPVQVFLDATAGTNLFFSNVDVQRETFFGNTQYAGGRSTRGYWAFIWGPGLGLEFPVGERKQVAISLKGSYLFGSNTKYLTDPVIDNDGTVYFTRHESKTDMLVMEAGVRFGIFREKRTYRD